MPAGHMPPRLGPPRRFAGDTERQLLVDAAITVMTVDCYAEVSSPRTLSFGETS